MGRKPEWGGAQDVREPLMGRKPEWGGAQDVREPPNATSAWMRKSSLPANGPHAARELGRRFKPLSRHTCYSRSSVSRGETIS